MDISSGRKFCHVYSSVYNCDIFLLPFYCGMSKTNIVGCKISRKENTQVLKQADNLSMGIKTWLPRIGPGIIDFILESREQIKCELPFRELSLSIYWKNIGRRIKLGGCFSTNTMGKTTSEVFFISLRLHQGKKYVAFLQTKCHVK